MCNINCLNSSNTVDNILAHAQKARAGVELQNATFGTPCLDVVGVPQGMCVFRGQWLLTGGDLGSQIFSHVTVTLAFTLKECVITIGSVRIQGQIWKDRSTVKIAASFG